MKETAQQYNDRIKGSLHVTPTNDLKPHNTFSDYCRCKPRVEWQNNGHRIIIHNAYDGRDFFELDNNNLIKEKDNGTIL